MRAIVWWNYNFFDSTKGCVNKTWKNLRCVIDFTSSKQLISQPSANCNKWFSLSKTNEQIVEKYLINMYFRMFQKCPSFHCFWCNLKTWMWNAKTDVILGTFLRRSCDLVLSYIMKNFIVSWWHFWTKVDNELLIPMAIDSNLTIGVCTFTYLSFKKLQHEDNGTFVFWLIFLAFSYWWVVNFLTCGYKIS